MRNAYKILVGKPGGREPFEKSRRRWEDNIKMSFEECGVRHGVDPTGSGHVQWWIF
jgi:hypothetical protein